MSTLARSKSLRLDDMLNVCGPVLSFYRHKSLLDYLQTQGFTETFQALQKETGQEGFVVDPKAKYAGLLEKKWTSVIRLQKKVSRRGSLIDEQAQSSILTELALAIRSWS